MLSYQHHHRKGSSSASCILWGNALRWMQFVVSKAIKFCREGNLRNREGGCVRRLVLQTPFKNVTCWHCCRPHLHVITNAYDPHCACVAQRAPTDEAHGESGNKFLRHTLSMDIHVSPWISIDIHGYPWVFLVTWTCVDILEYLDFSSIQ